MPEKNVLSQNNCNWSSIFDNKQNLCVEKSFINFVSGSVKILSHKVWTSITFHLLKDNRYQSIGDFEVRNKSWNEVGTGCRELDLKRKDNIAAKKKIIQFTFDLQVAESEKWSWKNIDEVLSQLEMLHRLVNEFASKGETRTKFVAHCSSGDRLSGFVVAAYRLQREIEVNFEEKRYFCFLFFFQVLAEGF